jgi:L-threonylcarbamoyladenylate synthase
VPPSVLRIDPDRPEDVLVARASGELMAGRLVIFPTDTLYAIGGRAVDPGAAVAVRAAKGRDEGKPLPLVAASPAQALAMARDWPDSAHRLAKAFWPGPLTLVLPASAGVPDGVTAGSGTVAIRVPASALCRALCAAVGPLVSTSANRSGEAPPSTCEEALRAVGSAVAVALDGGPAPSAVPSTIVDVTAAEVRLVREGAVSWTDVQRCLHIESDRGV